MVHPAGVAFGDNGEALAVERLADLVDLGADAIEMMPAGIVEIGNADEQGVGVRRTELLGDLLAGGGPLEAADRP